MDGSGCNAGCKPPDNNVYAVSIATGTKSLFKRSDFYGVLKEKHGMMEWIKDTYPLRRRRTRL